MTRSRVLMTALAVLGLLWMAVPAQAHNTLVGTDPSDGDTAEDVTQVQIEFVEDVLKVGLSVQVVGEDGVDYSSGDPRVEDVRFVVQDVSELPPGPYKVTWRVVGDDGHPIKGKFGFTVPGAAPHPSVTQPSATEPVPSATASIPAVVEPPDPNAPTVGKPQLSSPGWNVQDDGLKTLLIAAGVAIVVLTLRIGLARARK